MVRFDRAREKRRAKFAYNLYKFRDHLGRKLPQNEAGIVKHIAAVARYTAEYGLVQTDYVKVYSYIRRGITNESKRQSDNEELRKKFLAAKITEDAERKNRTKRCVQSSRLNEKKIMQSASYPHIQDVSHLMKNV